MTVYYGLVPLRVQYCIPAWSLASNTILDPLIKMQKRAIRYMTKSPQITPSKPLFHKLGVLHFKDLVKLETVTIMHNLKESSKFFNTSPPSISAIHILTN